MVYSLLAATLAAVAATSPLARPAVMQQPPPDPGLYHPGYMPDSSLPAIEGNASAPITVTVKKATPSFDEENAPQPDHFPFTITAKDMDTWKRNADNTSAQFADPDLLCAPYGTQEYSVDFGPNKRGTTNNVATWDLQVSGLLIPANHQQSAGGPIHHDEKHYVNSYQIFNGPRDAQYNDLNDDPIIVLQTIIRPAYND